MVRWTAIWSNVLWIMHYIQLDSAKAYFCTFELEPGSSHFSELGLFHCYLSLIYFSFLSYWPVNSWCDAYTFKKNASCQQLVGQQESWVHYWAYVVVNGTTSIYREVDCISCVNLMCSPLCLTIKFVCRKSWYCSRDAKSKFSTSTLSLPLTQIKFNFHSLVGKTET